MNLRQVVLAGGLLLIFPVSSAEATCVDVGAAECALGVSEECPTMPGVGAEVVIDTNALDVCVLPHTPGTEVCVDVVHLECLLGANAPTADCAHGTGVVQLIVANIQAVCVRK